MHDELEDLRNRKIKQLQNKQQKIVKNEIELQRKIRDLEVIAKQFLTKEAISRYSNLKVAHPELAIRAITIIAQAVNTNQLGSKIDDKQFKNLLVQLQSEKKDFKFIR